MKFIAALFLLLAACATPSRHLGDATCFVGLSGGRGDVTLLPDGSASVRFEDGSEARLYGGYTCVHQPK